MWRVGDGKRIDIWDQKWLPDLAYSKVVSPRIDTQINKICDLFLPNSKVWNADLINTMFYPWEASLITSTTLGEGEENDTLVWPLTPNGVYSVRTAYRLQENGVSQENPSSSSTDAATTVWKGVWKIHAPYKIRHFVWRALKDSLPIKPNLRIRNIMVDEACSLCEDGRETILHSLWYCEHAQTVWKAERSFVDLYKKQHRSFMDLFEMVNKEGSTFRTAWFATIAWSLWQRQNRIRKHQTTWPLMEIGRRAKAMVEEYFDAQKPKPLVTSRPTKVRWSPPTENLYKANPRCYHVRAPGVRWARCGH